MTVPTACPACGVALRIKPQHRGVVVACDGCTSHIEIGLHDRVACDGCGAELRINPRTRGKMIACKHCGARFRAPEVGRPVLRLRPRPEGPAVATPSEDVGTTPAAGPVVSPAEESAVMPAEAPAATPCPGCEAARVELEERAREAAEARGAGPGGGRARGAAPRPVANSISSGPTGSAGRPSCSAGWRRVAVSWPS